MLAITNASILLETGKVLDHGTILLRDGKIEAVGSRLDVPADAEVIDAHGKFVTPGIIDVHTHLGISEEGIGKEGADYNETSEAATPYVRAPP